MNDGSSKEVIDLCDDGSDVESFTPADDTIATTAGAVGRSSAVVFSNSLLRELAMEREQRNTSHSSKDRKKQRTNNKGEGVVQSSTPGSTCVRRKGKPKKDNKDDGSLALARRLQDEENRHASFIPGNGSGSSSFDGYNNGDDTDDDNNAASMALALALQRQEVEMIQTNTGSSSGQQMMTITPGSSDWINYWLVKENQRRQDCEGPPVPPEQRKVAISSDGTGNMIQQRMQPGGQVWSLTKPCVIVDDAGVSKVLLELKAPSGKVTCAENLPLLRGLCAWRKHILETGYETRTSAGGKWRSGNICTSLTCFLGRKYDQQGVLCLVATALIPITTITAFTALFPKDAKNRAGRGLSASAMLLIALFFQFPLHTKEALTTLQMLIKKLPKNTKKGNWTDLTLPTGQIWRAVMARESIDSRLRAVVLSRAHLP